MSFKVNESVRRDRPRRVRHRLACASAPLVLCACGDVFDFDAWRDALGDHGSGHSGPACGAGAWHQPFEPLGVEPADASLDVEPGASVSVAFSRPIDPASASLARLELVGAGSEPVPGSVAVDGCSITFTPSEGLVLNTAYSVRLDGEVRGRHGSEWNGALEAEFRTRDGVWSVPENVTTFGDTPQLAAGPGGTAALAWQVPPQVVGASVALAQFTPSEGWQGLPISGTSGGPYSVPRAVQVGDDGDIELLWYNTGETYAALYRVGEGLGETNDRQYQASTSDADGAIAAGRAWAAVNERIGIVLRHKSGDEPWRRTILVMMGDSVGPRLIGPRLTADSDGNLRVFWLTEQAVQVSTLGAEDDPTSWAGPQPLVSRDPAYVVPLGFFGLGFPLVDAESALGHSLLAWQEDERYPADPASGAASRVRVVQVAPDGSVDESRPEPLGALGNAFSPALAMNAGGDALLGWVESAGAAADVEAPSSVRVAFRAEGAAWSAALAPEASADARVRAPAVAIDASGNGHAVWFEIGPDGTTQLRAARFTRDAGALGGATAISGAAAPAELPPDFGGDAPRVVVDAAGRALAVWAAADGGIWSARFE